MNSFIGRFQKDLNKLQKSLEKEGDDLLAKIKKAAKAAQKSNVNTKRKEIEKLIEKKIRSFEPAFEKFYHEVKVGARKYGIDLTGFEETVKRTTRTAKNKLKAVQKDGRKGTKKKSTAAKATKAKTSAKAKPASKSPKKATSKTTRKS